MKNLWKALHVWRWSCNPAMSHVRDTTGGHSGRMVALAIQFGWMDCADAGELTKAIMFHDAHESELGDPPFGMKEADPKLAKAYAKAASRVNIANGWVDAGYHTSQVKFLDRLDAYLMAKQFAPHILDREDWFKAHRWLSHGGSLWGIDLSDML